MKGDPTSSQPGTHESLRAIPYEDTVAKKSPTLVRAVIPPSKNAQLKSFAGFRQGRSAHQSALNKTRSSLFDDLRRDSGLAPSTTSTARNSKVTLDNDVDHGSSIGPKTSLANLSSKLDEAEPGQALGRRSSSSETRQEPAKRTTMESEEEDTSSVRPPFLTILPDIPTSSFEDLTNPGQVQFSNRGSMLIGGKKAYHRREESRSRKALAEQIEGGQIGLKPLSQLPSRVLNTDEEMQSRKVRSMYQDASEERGSWAAQIRRTMANGQSQNDPTATPPQESFTIRHVNGSEVEDTAATTENYPSIDQANDFSDDVHDLAGGIEDWEDLAGYDVDRYGFIVPRKFSSQPSSRGSPQPDSSDRKRIQRTSSALQLASDTPRQSRIRLSSIRSAKSPTRSVDGNSNKKPASAILRPNSSTSSYRSLGGHSRLRSAANRLPHNKDRRCLEEAGDMLTLPPGLADIAEDQDDSAATNHVKARECDREEKWRKMAKVMNPDLRGGGMVFEFDTKSAKVIERTWKGIPDKWRATAWHAFLTASAKRRRGCESDENLMAIFKALIDQGSPDDIQIDIDVPRTINSHIMFRRRYRGGQRLLFRVLHCMSIYFPETGYVQGMAAIAATLLCYFNEEMTFVMMVRMWQLRGLERLYRVGFEGLMQCLDEFERCWMGKDEVAAKLTELNIPPTSYGTRWYLTLFNYSIPFPAQLRVWDVFMLLGERESSLGEETNNSFDGGMDVLHACSAALIDGTREILLDSDFENAMKVLTSWIPIKDEELLMRVAKVEWKSKRRRARRQ